MSGAEMHYQSEHAIAGLAQDHSIGCKGCSLRFVPKRPWQTFHSTACRTEYHQAHGHQGTVKRISKTKHGWSWTIHMSDGDWAQLGDTVQLVRR